MKKTFSFPSTAAAILATGALTASAVMTVFGAPLNDETAKTIALKNAGLKEEAVTFLELAPDTENGRSIYKVKFLTKDFTEYDYEILISDGTILNIDYEAKLAAAATQNAKATITLERAKEMALAQAGQTAENSTFVKESFEYENGIPVYETEFHTDDSKKYKYEFNGCTGAVISWEYDAWNWLAAKENPASALNSGKLSGGAGSASINADAAASSAANAGTVSPSVNAATGSSVNAAADSTSSADAISGPEAARAAALKMAKLKPSDVTWGAVKRDHEDGRLVYEGEFYYRSWKYEFELDGATGVMLDWEVESIYD